MNDQSQMMNRSFGIWRPPPPPSQPMGAMVEPMVTFHGARQVFKPGAGGSGAGAGAKPGRMMWKGKKALADKRKMSGNVGAIVPGGMAASTGGVGGASGYQPPALTELQRQNWAKTRRFFPKKKFTRFAPFAPRNTTSFIIRAKKSGGIASLVSPCPVTPAILPTPKFSPMPEGLADMAKEEFGVDGYGSMKGLIRLRSNQGDDDAEEEEGDGSSESDVEEHVEVERRLDHDLSRFEMVYPGSTEDQNASYLLENRVDDQDAHIAQLEEENLTLKERLFLMEAELGDLRRRLQVLETETRSKNDKNNNNNQNKNNIDGADATVEEGSENEGGCGDFGSERSADGECEEGLETPMRD